MLDVHPAPHAASTWRDFFIHIATIVLGLLIAVGLEQMVEQFHHRRQAREMVTALHDESIENRRVIQYDLVSVAEDRRILRLNMAALDRTRVSGGKESFSPAPFTHDAFFAPTDTAWLTLRGNGLLSLVPGNVADSYWKVDFMCQIVISDMASISDKRNKVNALLHLHSDLSGLSEEERAALLLAYSEMDQTLIDMHYILVYFDDGNERALAGKSLSVDTSSSDLDKTTPQ